VLRLRVSPYNIYVPVDQNEMLLIHAYCGSVDVVPLEVGERLQAGDLCLDQVYLDFFLSRGYCTTRTPEEERTRLMALADKILERQRSSVNFVVMPTFECNFACPYCFQNDLRDSGRYSGALSPDKVDAMFQAMESILAKKDSRNRKIVLYGGEPLLAKNRPVIEMVLAAGKGLGYVFEATTNGFELDAYLDLLGPGGIRRLQISVDGPAEIHNRYRVARSGESTFTRITENIERALDVGAFVNMRVNTNRGNLGGLEELARHIDQRGWVERQNFKAYVAAIHEGDNAGRQFFYVELLKELSRINRGLGKTVLHNEGGEYGQRLLKLMRGKLAAAYSPVACSAHLGEYVFGWDGMIYPCWEVVGHEGGSIGRYEPVFEIDERKADRWHSRTLNKLPECQRCRYALFCAGGCALHSAKRSADLTTPYCQGFDSVFQYHMRNTYESLVRPNETEYISF